MLTKIFYYEQLFTFCYAVAARRFLRNELRCRRSQLWLPHLDNIKTYRVTNPPKDKRTETAFVGFTNQGVSFSTVNGQTPTKYVWSNPKTGDGVIPVHLRVLQRRDLYSRNHNQWRTGVLRKHNRNYLSEHSRQPYLLHTRRHWAPKRATIRWATQSLSPSARAAP